MTKGRSEARVEGARMGTKPGADRKRKLWMTAAVAALVSLVGVSAAANQSFTDVPSDHLFHGDIEWMKESGVTRGCNPPANTEYCPEDNTTRGEMAAFFHRFANSQTVDAGWLEGHSADEFLRKDEAGDLEDLRGEPGPQGPQGEPGLVSTQDVTLLTAGQGDAAFVAAGNTYTVWCPDGQVAISGGYTTDFQLLGPEVDDLLSGIDLGVIGDLPIVGDLVGPFTIITNLGDVLVGVSNVNVHTNGPVTDGDQWGWQVGTTINLVSDISVTAMCVG